ncbi:hypothetical protein SB659_10490 [Arthrobacter sp. SIMBA_036]|uniref:hypothetical protein n=1 Tax=Arthrobacter sp. SIMBA_036 TaxID=3085778 RepID=UPI003978227D
MTRINDDTRTPNAFRLWNEPLFLTGVGLTLLAILTFETSKWFYAAGLALRLGATILALVAGVVLSVWALRRAELGPRRSGALALTCGIFGILGAGATYIAEQAIQHAMNTVSFGPLVILTITLAAFGAISLVGGIVKRINA